MTLERIVLSEASASRLRAETIGREAGTERPLAILICDMRDFTALADANSAFGVVHILNRFPEALGDPILLNGGIISHYGGYQICGLFGLGDADPARACTAAVRAAFAMVEAVAALNGELAPVFGTRIRIGIGVHHGNVIVGEVGHPTLRRFMIVGDAVNTASRIESMTKELASPILVSRDVADRIAPGALSVRATRTARLRGRRNDIELLSVDGFADPSPFALAQRSVARILADPAAFAARFYARLFALSPALERLFVNGTVAQGPMLAHALHSVLSGLGRRRHVAIGLQALGRSHVRYGVEPEHYDIFRAAMLGTIGELLCADLTPEVARSWSATLDVILGQMREGAGAAPRRRRGREGRRPARPAGGA